MVDRDHVYQPGLSFLPLGLYEADELVRPRDLVPQVRKVFTAGDFYEIADGGQVLFA